MKEEKQKFTLQIPSGITDIGDFAFRHESFDGIKSIVLPHSVEYIGESAFENANNVKFIVLSGGIKRIGTNAFARCKQLDSIAFRQGPPHCLNYLTQNGVLFERNYDRFSKSHGYTLFQYPCGRANKEYTIPVVVDDGATDGGVEVTEIGENAFMECQHLEAVYFTAYPGTKMKISRCAFAWCSNLDTVRLSKNISKIDPTAFGGCTMLEEVSIPKAITCIDYGAFSGCEQITSILLPDSIVSIGQNVFYGCKALKEIYIPNGSRDKFEKLLPKHLHDKLKELNH